MTQHTLNSGIIHGKSRVFALAFALITAFLFSSASAARAGTPCTTVNGGNYCPSNQYRGNPSLTGSPLSPAVTTNLLNPTSVANLELYFIRVTGGSDPLFGATSSPSILSRTIFGSANIKGDWGLWSYAVVGGSAGWNTTSQKMGAIVGSPAWDDGLITVGDASGSAWAFGYTTGSLVWKYTVPGESFLSSPSVFHGSKPGDVTGVYLVGSTGVIYRLNGSNGTLAWKTSSGVLGYQPPLSGAMGGPESSSVSLSSDSLFVAGTTSGSSTGVVKKYDSANGKFTWAGTVPKPVASAPVLNNAGGLVYVQQEIDQCYIYCSSLPLVVALDQSNGNSMWTGDTPTQPPAGLTNEAQPPCPNVKYSWLGSGSPAYDQTQNRVVIATTFWDYYGPSPNCGYIFGGTILYSYDATSGGSPQWTATTTHKITFSSPTVANGVVYIGTDDGYILAFNETDGSLLWQSPQANQGDAFYSPPVISFDRVQAVSNNGTLYVYCLPDGTGKGCSVSK